MHEEDLAWLSSNEGQARLAGCENEDPHTLALRGERILAEQSACRRKARRKLPDIWQRLLYDPSALEQASSQACARFKASLITGKRGLDTGAGLGIDTWQLSTASQDIHACEDQPHLAALLAHNLPALGCQAHIHPGDGLEQLRSAGPWDWAYLDPARRDKSGRHTKLEDCRPDLTQHHPELLTHAKQLLIKLSPAFEPRELPRQLSAISQLHLVSLAGECKELLALCHPGHQATPRLYASILNPNGSLAQQLSCPLDDPRLHAERPCHSTPGPWLLLPDPAIIRAGLVPLLAQEHSLSFLNPRIACLSAPAPIPNCPGTWLRHLGHSPYRRRPVHELLKAHQIDRVIIHRRHIPDPAASIRTRLKLQEGGTHYLLCHADQQGRPRCILAEKEP